MATAGEHDNRRARELCANVQAGEIVIFDKAYLDFAHLADLSQRGVFWVTRAKDNLQCRVVRKFQDGTEGNILRDDLIVLTNPAVQAVYPVELRRVTALVEVDGQWREMVFLTNNLEWSAQTIADLYRCRWSIEVFFKELKQTLQLADFLGHNANAVKWQVWTALLAYVLLRFCAHLGQWSHSFTRLFALIRSALWQKLELRSLLICYGTADGGGRFLGTPQQAYLAGSCGTASVLAKPTPEILKPIFHFPSRSSKKSASNCRGINLYWPTLKFVHKRAKDLIPHWQELEIVV